MAKKFFDHIVIMFYVTDYVIIFSSFFFNFSKVFSFLFILISFFLFNHSGYLFIYLFYFNCDNFTNYYIIFICGKLKNYNCLLGPLFVIMKQLKRGQ